MTARIYILTNKRSGMTSRPRVPAVKLDPLYPLQSIYWLALEKAGQSEDIHEDFKIRLEANFYGNMSWDNYGSHWHIDHIRPISSFDLTDGIQLAEACHYTNLQPLLARDNLKKNATWAY